MFCDVLPLAGSTTAATPWRQWLTLHFCDSERTGDDGRVADRRLVQVPDAPLPALRRWFDPDPGDDGTAPRTRRPVGPGERSHVEAVLGTLLDPGLEHRLRPAVA